MQTRLGYDIKDAPLDPINGLDQMYRDDTAPNKANLVVGVYQDEDGESPVLAVVKEAERRLLEMERSKAYLPVPGEDVVPERDPVSRAMAARLGRNRHRCRRRP